MLRIFHNTSYGFIKHWKLAAILTAAFIGAGLVTFAITGGVNYSIEFTGGTLMQVQFKQAPDVAVVRSSLDKAGITGSEIQQYGGPLEYTIRARDEKQVEAQAAGAEGVSKQIQAALDHLVKGRTTIAIAHRLGTLRKANRLVVLENGVISETGMHDTLMKSGGTYARLHAAMEEVNHA